MSDNQLTLNLTYQYPTSINTRDPNVESSDRKRLVGQNREVFELLKLRNIKNSELARRFLKYTSRISDIRKWLSDPLMDEPAYRNATIECVRCGGGLNEYRLIKQETNNDGRS
ncbi:MAG: hypothetical protein R3C03_24115 [Pirellulaceae bacterium]